MKKLKTYRLFTIIAVPILLIVSFIILYIEPGLAEVRPDFRYLFIWIVIASFGGGWLNFRYFSLLEEINDEKKIEQLLSRRGKYYLKKDPELFFNKEQLQRYFSWQKGMVLFFVAITALLYLALNTQLLIAKFGG